MRHYLAEARSGRAPDLIERAVDRAALPGSACRLRRTQQRIKKAGKAPLQLIAPQAVHVANALDPGDDQSSLAQNTKVV